MKIVSLLAIVVFLGFSSSLMANGFVNGTKITTEGEEIAVEALEINTMIPSTNIFNDKLVGTVSDLLESTELCVELSTKTRAITSSMHQKFATRAGWLASAKINVGDEILTENDGYQEIISSEFAGSHKVHSVLVEPTPTYYAEGFLVHSSCPQEYSRQNQAKKREINSIGNFINNTDSSESKVPWFGCATWD